MNVTLIQNNNLTVKNRVEPKQSFKLRGKPRFQKFSFCMHCGEPILQIKYSPRRICDDCKKPKKTLINGVHNGNNVNSVDKVSIVTKLQSDKVTKIKGLPLKEYRHQYYLKTVTLGWRHY